MKETKAIIAGNGPSLREIDYALLPKSYDLFRCNQFYFEEEYYLGKNLTYAFVNPGILFQAYYTLKSLELNGEYEINQIICSTYGFSYTEAAILLDDFASLYPNVIQGHTILRTHLPKFFEAICYYEIYEDRRITSGIYMCAMACALGYKELYLCGIDFYEGEKYAFCSQKQNLSLIYPNFKNPDFKDAYHSSDFDKHMLLLLQRIYGIQIYSLTPTSPLTSIISTPNQTNQSAHLSNLRFLKPKACTLDLLIPPQSAYTKLSKLKSKSLAQQKLLSPKIEELIALQYRNIYLRALRDIKRLFLLLKKKLTHPKIPQK